MVVVDKPAGPTSHAIVDRLRRVLGVRRIGHTGTLDPFATGVLPLCVGRATRLAAFLSATDKVYRATVRLGYATTTDDLEGEPLSEPRVASVARERVAEACRALTGELMQVPPLYSAKRVAGRRLYELARRGIDAPRAPARVIVHSLEVLAVEADRVELELRCSTGTYVRALARDLGAALGVGGHLSALRRLRSGEFDLSRAVPGDDLSRTVALAALMPLDTLLAGLPAVTLGAEACEAVRHGRDVAGLPAGAPSRVRLLDGDGALLALAVPKGGALHPDVVLTD